MDRSRRGWRVGGRRALARAAVLAIPFLLTAWAAGPAQAYPIETGPLVVVTGSLVPGARVTVVGHGFSPGASVSHDIFSNPRHLTTVLADVTGSTLVEVIIPIDLEPGRHELRATGTAADGATLIDDIFFTVAGGLPVTGAPIGLIMTASGLVLALGVAFVLVSVVRIRQRRRPADADLDA